MRARGRELHADRRPAADPELLHGVARVGLATLWPVDFKITDGLQKKEAFKRLTIRKTEELVGYGLGQAQPQLATSNATHLDAIEYHKALEDPDAIVVDVRNQYETEIASLPVQKSAVYHRLPRHAIDATPKLDSVSTVAFSPIAPDSLVD